MIVYNIKTTLTMNDITAIIVFFAVFRVFSSAMKALFGAARHNDFRRDR